MQDEIRTPDDAMNKCGTIFRIGYIKKRNHSFGAMSCPNAVIGHPNSRYIDSRLKHAGMTLALIQYRSFYPDILVTFFSCLG